MRRTQPWLISIPGLVQGENRLRFDLDIEELSGTTREVSENPSFQEILGKVRVDLVITRTGRKLLVNGFATFQARLICALCGEAFRQDFAERLSTQFVGQDEEEDKTAALEPEDLELELVQGNLLNLGPVVRDAIHLAVPIAPRCRQECLGVCPVCGCDLNTGHCNCAR